MKVLKYVLMLCEPFLCQQSRLEECLKKQADLQKTVDVAKKEMETEREDCRKVRRDWESEREAMREEIAELRDNLRHSCDMLKNVEGKHNVRRSHVMSLSKKKTHKKIII